MVKTSNAITPVTLVTGLLGSGKTTLIRQLIQQKPASERWALLINEFGEIGLDAQILQSADTPLFEVKGGCICCSAHHQLQRTIERIRQQAPFDRLIIEPTGLGHPAQIIDLIQRQPDFVLQNTLCLLDTARFNAALWQKSALVRDLISLADVIVFTKTDLISSDTLQQQRDFLHALSPPKHGQQISEFGQIPLNMIQQAYPRPALMLLHSRDHAVQPGLVTHFNSQLPLCTQAIMHSGQPLSIGWVWQPNILFNRTQLKRWLQSPPIGLLRAKGLLRMGKEWQLINWIDGQLTFEDIAWRQDSRLEMLFENQPDHTITPQKLEQNLAQSIQIRDL